MWDAHIRLAGAAGTNLQHSHCPSGSENPDCAAAFLALHLTEASNAYLEGTWVWLADHDLDGDGQITVWSGRGILSESQGPVWMIGTGSEHHTIYQYNLVNAADHYMGLIQTETPYYQPVPPAPKPFTISKTWKDPDLMGQKSAWAFTVKESSRILVFGAGLYSFFDNYTQTCLNSASCQNQVLNIDDSSTIWIYSLSTVGTTKMLSIEGKGIISQSDNINGFASTVTAWTR